MLSLFITLCLLMSGCSTEHVNELTPFGDLHNPLVYPVAMYIMDDYLNIFFSTLDWLKLPPQNYRPDNGSYQFFLEFQYNTRLETYPDFAKDMEPDSNGISHKRLAMFEIKKSIISGNPGDENVMERYMAIIQKGELNCLSMYIYEGFVKTNKCIKADIRYMIPTYDIYNEKPYIFRYLSLDFRQFLRLRNDLFLMHANEFTVSIAGYWNIKHTLEDRVGVGNVIFVVHIAQYLMFFDRINRDFYVSTFKNKTNS